MMHAVQLVPYTPPKKFAKTLLRYTYLQLLCAVAHTENTRNRVAWRKLGLTYGVLATHFVRHGSVERALVRKADADFDELWTLLSEKMRADLGGPTIIGIARDSALHTLETEIEDKSKSGTFSVHLLRLAAEILRSGNLKAT